MIIGYLLIIINSAVVYFLSLLPIGGLPSEVVSAAQSLGGYMAAWNTILPVSTMITIVGLVVTMKIAVFSFRIGLYVVHLIRGSAMPGHHTA